MSFDSLDVYQEVTVPANEYGALKDAICRAYIIQRSGLKSLLDAVQPIAKQRISAARDGQKPLRIFSNAAQEILQGGASSVFNVYPGIVSDLQHLCMVMNGTGDEAVYGHDDYWSVRDVSEETFEECWPTLVAPATKLKCHSRSNGYWSFNDSDCKIELHIASDWQGDQFGLNNLMTKTLDQAVAAMPWSGQTGSIVFTVDEHGFYCPRSIAGCPPQLKCMSDEEWPMFLEFARKQQAKLDEEHRRQQEEMQEDIAF